MPDLWRISNHLDLSGEGGLRYSARWHTAGRRILYLAESPAGALVEILVHLELLPEQLPPPYTLLRITSPESLSSQTLPLPRENDWKSNIKLTRHLGDSWLASNISALARVPSAILPHTFNMLLNPQHPEAALLTIAEATRASFDPRLHFSTQQQSRT